MSRAGAGARELLGAIDAVYLIDTVKRRQLLEARFPGVEILCPREHGWSGCQRMIRLGEWVGRIRDRTVVVWLDEEPNAPTREQMRRVGRVAVEHGARRAYGQIHVDRPRPILMGDAR